jgi:NTE family protein
VHIGGRGLIDGGLVTNTPIANAVALGAERVYVLPTMDRAFARPLPRRNPLAAAIDGLGALMRNRLEAMPRASPASSS